MWYVFDTRYYDNSGEYLAPCEFWIAGSVYDFCESYFGWHPIAFRGTSPEAAWRRYHRAVR